jgi:hypothetical protein
MGVGKDIKFVITELERQGWEVERTSQGHWRARPSDKTKQLVHFSTSDDRHSLKNVLADLRRSGFEWPPPSKKEERSERPSQPGMDVDDFDFSPMTDPVPVVPSPPETQEQIMDRLWTDLKESKGYLNLADEHMKECERRLEEAQQAFNDAKMEREQAAEKLRVIKERFDAAFEVAA